MRSIATALAIAGALALLGAVGSASAEPSGRDFGQHIACVALNGDNLGGLSGTRNPGRHQGYSNVADTFATCPADEGPAATRSPR